MSRVFILARALVYATLFVGFGLVFIPAQILRRAGIDAPTQLGARELIAMALVLAGGGIVLASLLSFVFVGGGTAAPFDPPRRLVTAGPFRFVRNPIYIGALIGLAGAALYYRSWGLVLYGAILAVVFHVIVRGYEEPLLRRSFGADYENYCTRVRRWIPRWSIRHG